MRRKQILRATKEELSRKTPDPTQRGTPDKERPAFINMLRAGRKGTPTTPTFAGFRFPGAAEDSANTKLETIKSYGEQEQRLMLPADDSYVRNQRLLHQHRMPSRGRSGLNETIKEDVVNESSRIQIGDVEVASSLKKSAMQTMELQDRQQQRGKATAVVVPFQN